MAAGQLSLTRRALLAAGAAPALAAAGAEAASPSSRRKPGSPGDPHGAFPNGDPGFRRDDGWKRALARYRRADSALAAVAHTEDEDLYDRLGSRHHDALQHLLRTPAPDVAALALKLDLALDERVVEYLGDLAAMQAIKADARRLS
ncbi:MAG: hypothetical protein JO013_06325 [Alphaproteobacteria bacterium]|nr:hypothetical protein [Alphaproteobacteria bacterium]